MLNTARSAVVSLCIQDISVGTHPLVKRFIKGVFNNRPVFPKTTVSWDMSEVLRHLKEEKSAHELTFKELTLKLVMVLALLSAQRVETLVLLSINAMTFNWDRVKFKVNGLLKQTKPGVHQGDIELQRYSYCRRLHSDSSSRVYCTGR